MGLLLVHLKAVKAMGLQIAPDLLEIRRGVFQTGYSIRCGKAGLNGQGEDRDRPEAYVPDTDPRSMPSRRTFCWRFWRWI